MKDIKDNPWLSFAVAVAMLLGGSSGALSVVGARDATASATALEARLTTIEMTLTQIASDKETMGKHWRLHSWAKDEINALRAKHDLDASRWPDL